MTKLETIINTILQQLKPQLANATWESRRRYFNQMLKCANLLGITEPCSELYDKFIKDDNGSPERHSLHVYCVKLVDALACTRARDEHGILFNEPPMPDDSEVHKVFEGQRFPITADICIDHLIAKAEIEIKHLGLTDSTIGQYKHSWMDIRRYFYDAGVSGYDETLIKSFIQEITTLRNKGSMKEWKWKINRKAAYVLMEVASTGHYHWRMISRENRCNSSEIEAIRSQYLESLEQRNLSRATIKLYDYVFRKTTDFAELETPNDLLLLSPEKIHLIVAKFAGVCNRRSMATILPILRSLLTFFYTSGLLGKDLSGIVMGSYVQRGSVAAYISKKDQTKLLTQLERESGRTKAIILLAMHLGLRDCDICNLTFRAIDWQNDRIRLIQKKNR